MVLHNWLCEVEVKAKIQLLRVTWWKKKIFIDLHFDLIFKNFVFWISNQNLSPGVNNLLSFYTRNIFFLLSIFWLNFRSVVWMLLAEWLISYCCCLPLDFDCVRVNGWVTQWCCVSRNGMVVWVTWFTIFYINYIDWLTTIWRQ